MRALAFVLGSLIALAPAAARAEFQISVYGGVNAASDSDVTLDQGALSGTFGVEWFGDSFNLPPYYGVRGTYWLSSFGMPSWGAAIDFTHAKVKADLTDPSVGGTFSTLELTNGLNSATLNALYRAPLNSKLTVYGGAGAGVSFPHVEVETIPSVGKTFEYQITGPVVEALIGIDAALNRRFSVFAEYKASYSWNHADLVGGGTLDADVLAHHFAAGVSVKFGGQP